MCIRIQLTSLRLDNHKPNLSAPPKEKLISQPPNSGKKINLTIKGTRHGEDYLYTGSQQPSGALALVYSPQTQAFILDKISADLAFNLSSTPSNKNAKSLASQYPHLPVVRDSEPESTNSNNSSDENDGNDLSTGADSTNPYDYRHFLTKRRGSSSPEQLATTPNTPASPLRPIPASSPPRRTPARPKPKPKPRPRPAPKRAPSPPAREEADADNEDSDDGGLTIEMEPDTNKTRRFKPTFTHDPRNGPISLRSAASTSASPALSPTNRQQSDEGEDVDIMYLEQDGTEDVDIVPIPKEVEEVEEDEKEEEGEDEGGEGSLEAELEHALEQADGEADGEYDGVGAWANNDVPSRREAPHVNIPVDDSSSESEEE